jgi:hypothetical protein
MAPACSFGFRPASPVRKVSCQNAFWHEFPKFLSCINLAEAILWSRLLLTQEFFDVFRVACCEDIAGFMVVVFEERVFEPGLGSVGADFVVGP